MNKKNYNSLRRFIYPFLVLGLVTVPGLLLSAPIPPGPGGTSPTPIDGGIGFLVLAGLTYGAKKWHDIAKKNN